MVSRKFFYLFGILMFFILSVRLILSIMTGTFSIVEIASWSALTFMSFAIGYLQPQVHRKDERMQYIKKTTMHYSLRVIVSFIFVLTITLQTNLLTLKSIEVLAILTGFSTITIFTIWIIISKRN